ncbi:deaminase [Aureibacter tunicatorum]|uniref:tRNA(Arg) A34 adenosine deaminase TadA n=1 Tax=Aureibacter tunicatorum TaxID=866807 RepID=A0AAE3XQM7_9BACT|nr:deaminase [Aureibacter tunicatorum]MDR6239614.1 tRNA(Arg) A34 adenosine deaminase TadA [Aureibacter tunicatorum]BDD04091.1 hypothetical protein AUTU_15740 [Aureibacter tunicatorum]
MKNSIQYSEERRKMIRAALWTGVGSLVALSFDANARAMIPSQMQGALDDIGVKAMKKAYDDGLDAYIAGEGGPFGACLVCNGEIVSSAQLSIKRQKNALAEAELLAIQKASEKLKKADLSDCEIYMVCAPSPLALTAIMQANIKKAYYSLSLSQSEPYSQFRSSLWSELNKFSFSESSKFKQTMESQGMNLLSEIKSQGQTEFEE